MLVTFQEMERFNNQAGEKDQGAVATVLDLAIVRTGQSSSGVGVGDAFHSSHKDLACAMRQHRTPAEGRVRRMCGGDHHGHSPGSKGVASSYVSRPPKN